jgi:hypothetical protein
MNDALLLGVAAISAWHQLWSAAVLFAGMATFGTAFVLIRAR